jgi:hypothetical protein
MNTTKEITISNTALENLESKAAGFVTKMIKNLSPKFLRLADEVLSMSTEVNAYVEDYQCVDFKNAPGADGYQEVTFLVTSLDGEVLPFDRTQLNTKIRDIVLYLDFFRRSGAHGTGVSFEEVFGSLEKPEGFDNLDSLSFMQAAGQVVRNNLDLIYDRIISGDLDPERLGMEAGGKKRVTISSVEELLPAVALFYMEVLAEGHGAVSIGQFFEGGWCITGIISVLDIHLLGKVTHG